LAENCEYNLEYDELKIQGHFPPLFSLTRRRFGLFSTCNS
jgi:hypothetical protein